MTYWHFTCHHSAERIDLTGVLVPSRQPMLGDLYLTWFSTLRYVNPHALGLASRHLVTCDRMESVYAVMEEDEDKVVRWGDLKRDPRFEPFLPGARLLDAARAAKPGLWAVAAQPVHVRTVI